MLDHLVLATPDLAATVSAFTQRTGVAPARGGSHTGRGTANFLVGLGGEAYLEIVGPDVDQPEPARPRPFGVDTLARATLVTWAVHPSDLDATIARARAAGVDPGDAEPMSRATPEGEALRWRLTPPGTVVPFLIDWGTTPHPTTRGLPELALRSFTVSHPDPAALAATFAALGVTADVVAGEEAALRAELDTPRGVLALP